MQLVHLKTLTLLSSAVAFTTPVNHRVGSRHFRVRESRVSLRNSNIDAIHAESTRLVWLTGFGDLRAFDHPGLAAAAAESNTVVPLFVLDDSMHLKNQPEWSVRRLHASIVALAADLPDLVFRSSSSFSSSSSLGSVLCEVATESQASKCFVVEDDVAHVARTAVQAACVSLLASSTSSGSSFELARWSPGLRPTAPWEPLRPLGKGKHATATTTPSPCCFLPREYDTYRLVADGVPLRSPSFSSSVSTQEVKEGGHGLGSEGLPSVEDLLKRAEACTDAAVALARKTSCPTNPPFSHRLLSPSAPPSAPPLPTNPAAQLDLFLKLGPAQFADTFLTAEAAASTAHSTYTAPDAVDGVGGSLHAAAMRWVLEVEKDGSGGEGGPQPNTQPSTRLAVLEPATRLLAAHVASGSISQTLALSLLANNKNPKGLSSAGATGAAASSSFSGRMLDALTKKAKGGVSPTAAAAAAGGGGGGDKGASLAKSLEWAEWHRLFARSEVEALEEKEHTEGHKLGDRGQGPSRYWRWNGEHLVRYREWSAPSPTSSSFSSSSPSASSSSASSSSSSSLSPSDNAASTATSTTEEEEEEPVLVLVHGFGASADQWERLVKSLTNPCRSSVWAAQGLKGPPKTIYALDLLGFGHSAKPGLTYTQHLWEAQIADFVVEVCGAKPFVLAGNSIGGGLSCGVAANLGPLCKGLVLCNTAGNILDSPPPALLVKEEDSSSSSSSSGGGVGGATLLGAQALGSYYQPPPLTVPGLLEAPQVLEGFGDGLIAFLKPQIPNLLKKYYPVAPDNADSKLASDIARAAGDPGAGNVIGSGQKLPPQRPLDEVLGQQPTSAWSFHGPVLVAQGILDPLAGAERTQVRLQQLTDLRPGITGVAIKGGHCPHDEVPDLVATAIAEWWPNVVK